MPKCSRRASYQSPADRYSASACRQTELEDSPPAEFSFSATAYVAPGHPARFVRHGSAGAPFYFRGPCGFNLLWSVPGRVVKAGEQFSRDVRAFVDG
jgi:hypothetical protein